MQLFRRVKNLSTTPRNPETFACERSEIADKLRRIALEIDPTIW